MDGLVLPATDRGRRIGLGTEAQRLREGVAIASKDPVLFETYGEFPLPSLDLLLDRAEALLEAPASSERRTIVDVGSGCGRLALYMALSRRSWDVYGIEISPVFHNEAIKAVDRAIGQGCLLRMTTDEPGDEKPEGSSCSSSSRLTLRCGPAQDHPELLQRADLIFCYSTAFESAGFSEESAAMLLGHDWTALLAGNTRPECLCITTDKALDPAAGWTILDRMDVPNPEVFESTGYIQRRMRR